MLLYNKKNKVKIIQSCIFVYGPVEIGLALRTKLIYEKLYFFFGQETCAQTLEQQGTLQALIYSLATFEEIYKRKS